MIVTIEIDNGGPVFPSADNLGMSLRDYFAAKAMQGFIVEGGISDAKYEKWFIAKGAYEMADAMLNERDDKNKLLSYSVYDLTLDVRTLNCLRAEGIETIGELCGKHTYELKKVPNLGKKCLKNIVDALAEHGLKLRS